MVTRKKQDLRLLNDIIMALNDYLITSGIDKKLYPNRKGRLDDIKAIARYVFSCAALQSPLDVAENNTSILPFLQSGSLHFDSTVAPSLFFRMVIGIHGVLNRIETSIGQSRLRNIIAPLLAKWEQHLLSRDFQHQGVVVPADLKYGWNTSSHAYQSIKVSFLTRKKEPRFALSGSTMNLLNFNASTEKPFSYLKRKERQFAKLIEISTADKKDFMFLQEVDCLIMPSFFTDIGYKDLHAEILQNFLFYLRNLGYEIITNVAIAQGRPFAILYNTKTLKPTGNMRMVLDGAGFECEFSNIESHKKVTLVNLHLDNQKDYAIAIPAYQEEQIAADRLTILGGANIKIQELINHKDHCTNLNFEESHAGFMLSTSSKTMANIEELPGEVFEDDPEFGGFMCRPLFPDDEFGESYSYWCPPGEAWKPKQQIGTGAGLFDRTKEKKVGQLVEEVVTPVIRIEV